MINKTIDTVLDLEPLVPEASVPALVPSSAAEVDEDFVYARSQMVAAIEKGQEALSGIVDLASMSQNPRSYEVVATLVNAVAGASKDLLELSKRKQELKGDTGRGPSTVNQNLYVGSTAELLKLLKGKAPVSEE